MNYLRTYINCIPRGTSWDQTPHIEMNFETLKLANVAGPVTPTTKLLWPNDNCQAGEIDPRNPYMKLGRLRLRVIYIREFCEVHLPLKVKPHRAHRQKDKPPITCTWQARTTCCCSRCITWYGETLPRSVNVHGLEISFATGFSIWVSSLI